MANPPGNPIVIVIAGEARKGKSKVLNNIFGTDFPVSDSTAASPIEIHVREVKKNGRSYILVDIPGFGTSEKDDAKIRDKFTDLIRGLDFTLLYCLPMFPPKVLGDSDKKILYNLQKCLHNRIWEKTVLLLTFSDESLQHFIDNPDNDRAAAVERFKGAVAECAKSFQKLLSECLSVRHTIHTVFDYSSDSKRKNSGFPGMVAVPVRKVTDKPVPESNKFDRDPDIIPGVDLTTSWAEVAMDEINTKTEPLQGELKVKNFKFAVTTAGTTIAGGAAGAAAGAGAGMAIGVVGGPIGIAVGAAIGGPVGAVVGLVSGVTVGAGISYKLWMGVKPEEKIRILREKIPR